ncbi:MAG: ABC transporter ATP-binding protein [Clostridiales bacterium]|nr:ABC transporter ATP-binding protein [Clostridiales bacterium]
MPAPLLSLQDVSLIYHDREGETPAIQNLSFSVYPGEFVAIVGPSGCGKTTVLSLIMGLLQPTSGTLTLQNGRADIGYMLQSDHLLEWRTVEKNVLLGLEVRRALNPQTRAKAREILQTYGLGDFMRHRPAQLSGGMRQKAALLRTLVLEPNLLLLDEPFSALDYQTRLGIADEVYDIIKREGKTAVLVTHDIAEALSLSDRVLIFSGRPASVKTEIRIALDKTKSPLQRRSEPEFQAYFQRVWGDLNQ